MDVADVLSRLHAVRPTGRDRWIARCPAHEDHRPSLAVRCLQDGRILMHCFAGCEPLAVLRSIGLEFTDLFPEPPERIQGMPRIRAPFSPMDALRCLAAESAIIALAASDLAEGRVPGPADAERIAQATGRIASALEAVHG